MGGPGADIVGLLRTSGPRRQWGAGRGAEWLPPEAALLAETDVLVPAALGDVLSEASVPRLTFVVNAGGVIFGCLVDVRAVAPGDAMRTVEMIGSRVEALLDVSERTGCTPYEAAMSLSTHRLGGPAKALRFRDGGLTTAAPH